MTSIILDLDNCIADDEWRIPRINWQHPNPFQRYHDYHILSAFDEIDNTDLLETEHDIIIFTARPSHYRTMTEEWLLRKGVEANLLLMRAEGDDCHSKELKLKQLGLLAEHGVLLGDVVCAYDDRPDVVRMYNAFGINAVIRSIHNVCAYTQPKEQI